MIVVPDMTATCASKLRADDLLWTWVATANKVETQTEQRQQEKDRQHLQLDFASDTSFDSANTHGHKIPVSSAFPPEPTPEDTQASSFRWGLHLWSFLLWGFQFLGLRATGLIVSPACWQPLWNSPASDPPNQPNKSPFIIMYWFHCFCSCRESWPI